MGNATRSAQGVAPVVFIDQEGFDSVCVGWNDAMDLKVLVSTCVLNGVVIAGSMGGYVYEENILA